MKETVHMAQSITGPLMNWKKADWKKATRWIHKLDGSDYSAEELKMEFIRLLSQGKECVPIGKCDNFDYKTGCKGHPIKDICSPTPE